MSDVVERLRHGPKTSDLYEAADEIERLRAAMQAAMDHAQWAADEIMRLRAVLSNLREALSWIAEDDGGRAGDCARDALGIKP